jgi:hypothetical protein
MCSYPKQNNPGAFVPTTTVFDVSAIYSTDVNSPEFKELIVRLQQAVNNMSLVLNIKDSGYYTPVEFVNGQLFFPAPRTNPIPGQPLSYRQVFRKVINFGALPNNATKSVPHQLLIHDATNNLKFTFTRIYGAASDLVNNEYIPLPYASSTGDNVELYVTNSDVVVKTSSDWTLYTTTYVILEYLKN